MKNIEKEKGRTARSRESRRKTKKRTRKIKKRKRKITKRRRKNKKNRSRKFRKGKEMGAHHAGTKRKGSKTAH